MYRQSKNNLLNSNISSTCPPQYGELQPILTASIGWRVCGTPANFNRFRVLASLLHRRLSTEVNKTLQDVRPSPVLVHRIYIFGGSYPLTEFCQLQNLLSVQLFRSFMPTLLHGTRAAAISQTLWRGTRNGITELTQRAPPIFGWAAVTLGIGPDSSIIIAAVWIRAGHYIFVLWFLSSSFFFLSFFFFSSPNCSRLRLDVYHTSTHGVALVRI